MSLKISKKERKKIVSQSITAIEEVTGYLRFSIDSMAGGSCLSTSWISWLNLEHVGNDHVSFIFGSRHTG
jgi:hypothetical protein